MGCVSEKDEELGKTANDERRKDKFLWFFEALFSSSCDIALSLSSFGGGPQR
jgi:hypothetical protein